MWRVISFGRCGGFGWGMVCDGVGDGVGCGGVGVGESGGAMDFAFRRRNRRFRHFSRIIMDRGGYLVVLFSGGFKRFIGQS